MLRTTALVRLVATEVLLLACGVSIANGLQATANPRGMLPPEKGDRTLAMSLTIAENDDFPAALTVAREAGMEATSLPLQWDDLEAAPATYESEFLDIANAYYPTQGVVVSLEVNPIDTNNVRLPADLLGLPYDHPLLIARYKALLDWVFSRIPQLELNSFVIGNEIDATLGANSPAWNQYINFFSEVSAHVRLLRPGLKVGAKGTFEGLTGFAKPWLQALNQSSDAVFATYYPLTATFLVRPPGSVHQDFDTLTGDYPAREILLLETGYPSGALNQSSEHLQAAFVRELFRAWDKHREVLTLVEFVWLHDVPQAVVDDWLLYYGVSDPAFAEYLLTLGLRSYAGDGTDKPAFQALRREAAARGW